MLVFLFGIDVGKVILILIFGNWIICGINEMKLF